MKQVMMLCFGIALFASSNGCCWTHPYGGGCVGGACGTPSYYGGGVQPGYPVGSAIDATSTSAALPTTTPYAYSVGAPVTAGMPINSLPTY